MKNYVLTFVCMAFLFVSCSNDDDFVLVEDFDTIGQTFEIDNVNFVSNDGLSATVNVPIPNDIEVFPSDVPLVFVLDPVESDNAGADVFEPLPRVFFFDNNGFAQFRFNFIFDDPSGVFDLDITLESDDFDALGPDFTDNQIFRIVIVPSEFASAPENQDLTFGQVMSKLNLEL